MTIQQEALQNAQKHQHLPTLPKEYKFKTLELFIGSQLEPVVTWSDGVPSTINLPSDPEPVVQYFGDDGFVFISVDGITKLNRIQDCGLPDINDFFHGIQDQITHLHYDFSNKTIEC